MYREQWLAASPYVNEKMTCVVRQAEATQYGLPLEFCFFLKEKGGNACEHQLAELMEWAYVVAPVFGLLIDERSAE